MTWGRINGQKFILGALFLWTPFESSAWCTSDNYKPLHLEIWANFCSFNMDYCHNSRGNIRKDSVLIQWAEYLHGERMRGRKDVIGPWIDLSLSQTPLTVLLWHICLMNGVNKTELQHTLSILTVFTYFGDVTYLILPSATCSWINFYVDPGTTLLLTNQIWRTSLSFLWSLGL